MSSDLAISVRDVTKVYRIYDRPEHRLIQMATLGRIRRFREFAALHNISLDVYRGETVGIVGRNGSGKSTLLQIICGTLQPSLGAVTVHGRIAALLELGAGFNPEFSGRENVYMNGAILGFSREEMDARFDKIAEFAAIGEFIERPVKTYSSGMFVRLAFAVATSVDPDILIVDEALAVGDEAFQRKCFARIDEIKERGGTILFVSHGAQTVIQLCDRAILLDNGEKLLEGSPKIVISNYQKLVNALPDRAGALRQEIALLGAKGPIIVPEKDEAAPSVVARDRAAPDLDPMQEEPPEPEVNLEAFDEKFVSQTVIEYGVGEARISNIGLFNRAGQQVNTLMCGKRYCLRYDVTYNRDVDHAVFGMLIKTTSGIELGGAATIYYSDEVLSFRTGDTVRVEINFVCQLTPGVYFSNAGASMMDGGNHVYLHRVVDAVIFRVMSDRMVTFSGTVDFSAHPRLMTLPGTVQRLPA